MAAYASEVVKQLLSSYGAIETGCAVVNKQMSLAVRVIQFCPAYPTELWKQSRPLLLMENILPSCAIHTAWPHLQ